MKLAVTLPEGKLIKPCIERGADILIIGVNNFTHRMTKSFDLETVKVFATEIHHLKKAVWINMNALLHETDLTGAEAALKTLKNYPIDGILFADLAIASLAESLNMSDLLIYYPETYTTSKNDVLFWQREGIKSLVIGREMTLEAIHKMHEVKAFPLTLVGHGFLNMFHSRRPLIENFFKHTGDADAKLVKDKKTLTLIEEQRNESYPIVQDQFGTHIFRDKPLSSFSVLKNLKNTIDTMIIDGLFLSEETLLSVIKDYQTALENKPVKTDYTQTTDDGFYFKKTGMKQGENK